ncbi:GGDEF domain-containing protein [Uliginosibacterium paludis]|uniref:diguanylate cyclase n=1 Tax=Uliginosibacterium paludis TaxID=1615952 RepID=A0ABV2CQD8_9RHOO
MSALAFGTVAALAIRAGKADGLKALTAGLLLKSAGHFLLAGLGEDWPRLAVVASGCSEALFFSCLMLAVAGLRQERPGVFWIGYPVAAVGLVHLILPGLPGLLVEHAVLILQGRVLLHVLIRHAARRRGRGHYLVMAGVSLNVLLVAVRGTLGFKGWMEGSAAVSDLSLLQDIGSLGLVCLCLIVSGFLLCAREAAEEQARRDVDSDPLTGCLSRPKILERALGETRRWQRYGQAFSLVVIDLDHFRAINDTRGHAGGDEILREFAQRLRQGIRETDVLGRWGNDEFVLVLPATTAAEACLLAERIRDAIVGRPLCGLRVTASIGVTACRPGESFYECFLRADLAAFRARTQGPGRVVLADEANDPAGVPAAG